MISESTGCVEIINHEKDVCFTHLTDSRRQKIHQIYFVCFTSYSPQRLTWNSLQHLLAIELLCQMMLKTKIHYFTHFFFFLIDFLVCFFFNLKIALHFQVCLNFCSNQADVSRQTGEKFSICRKIHSNLLSKLILIDNCHLLISMKVSTQEENIL